MRGERWVSLLAVMALACGSAVSAEIYQWRDAGGRIHFVDDPSKVPAKYREKAKRNVDGLPAISSENTSKAAVEHEGKAKWEMYCAECHVAGQERERGKVSLFPVLIDSGTKYPVSRSRAVWEFRRAADGHYSDMDAIDISDEELGLIAEYLLDMQK